jgi:hypothetical protein
MVKKRVLQAQEAIQGEKMIEVKLRFWQVAEKLKNTAPFGHGSESALRVHSNLQSRAQRERNSW